MAEKKPEAFYWKLNKEHTSAGGGAVAEKKPDTLYWKLPRPLNIPCGFTFASSARMSIENVWRVKCYTV